MTTFVDFRYSRALTAALFAGQEREEVDIVFSPDHDGYVALDAGHDRHARALARLVDSEGRVAGRLSVNERGLVAWRDATGTDVLINETRSMSGLVALCVGPRRSGIRIDGRAAEKAFRPFAAGSAQETLRLICEPGVAAMGRGTGRAAHWAQLFYHRPEPSGLCAALTMDWHHLRAGIPLIGTMTAEALIAQGNYRLRFQSYADDRADASISDFARLFGCDAAPDIALHLSPALYLRRLAGIPNMAYTVTESERVHRWLVDRCNSADRTCVPSTFVRDVMRRGNVTSPLEVVHHGVDSGYFRPVPHKAPLPGGRRFNFLAVTTNVERKNVKYLVRAFLEEFREHEDVALYLLLRPEYLTTQNNIALEFTDWEQAWARNSAPIFFWTGYVTQAHLRDFYANANAYVMPSNEGFGLTLLEAMACGTPTIALNRGGVVDFVSSANGILVPVGKRYVAHDIDTLPYVGDVFYQPDIRALRQAMRRLVQDQDLTKRLGERARVDAEKFDWQVVSAEFIRCLEQTYAESRTARRVAAASMRAGDQDTGGPDSRLTIALCVVDDEDARASLEYLREWTATPPGDFVLCLFTRYARVANVVAARESGFGYYNWDGTLENAKRIAHALMGPGWMVVLTPRQRLAVDRTRLTAILRSLPADVREIAVDSGANEPRVVRTEP